MGSPIDADPEGVSDDEEHRDNHPEDARDGASERLLEVDPACATGGEDTTDHVEDQLDDSLGLGPGQEHQVGRTHPDEEHQCDDRNVRCADVGEAGCSFAPPVDEVERKDLHQQTRESEPEEHLEGVHQESRQGSRQEDDDARGKQKLDGSFGCHDVSPFSSS